MTYYQYPQPLPPTAETRNWRSPKFVPPHGAGCPMVNTNVQAPISTAAARVARLIAACHLTPELILDYIWNTGQGKFDSLHQVPVEVLAQIAQSWPDVVTGIVLSNGDESNDDYDIGEDPTACASEDIFGDHTDHRSKLGR